MDRSRILTLISTTYTQDALMQQVPQETSTDVFCDVTSVSAEEILAAGQSGLKPEWRVIMFAYDYNGQQIVELDGVRYSVYRTYLGSNETIELYLERKAGV